MQLGVCVINSLIFRIHQTSEVVMRPIIAKVAVVNGKDYFIFWFLSLVLPKSELNMR